MRILNRPGIRAGDRAGSCAGPEGWLLCREDLREASRGREGFHRFPLSCALCAGRTWLLPSSTLGSYTVVSQRASNAARPTTPPPSSSGHAQNQAGSARDPGRSVLDLTGRLAGAARPPPRRRRHRRRGCDLLVLAVPDAAVGPMADRVAPVPSTVVAHLAGSLGTDVLGAHPRRAAIHPVVALPDPVAGADRLAGAWFAVAGDALAGEVVAALGGRSFPVAEEDRGAHHAACAIAADHVTALLGVVERVVGAARLPLAPYVELARGAVAAVADRGPPPP